MLGLWRRLVGGSSEPDVPMKVIVGLGNPGREYANTRHNVGWWVLDHLADVWRFDGWRKDGVSLVTGGNVGSTRVKLVKPQTYMNLSGQALRPFLRRTTFSVPDDLLIVVDEVALPVGAWRFREKGSPGGHNGLKDIERAVGGPEYPRLRIGVGPEPGRKVRDLSDYVLRDFGKAEADVIRESLPVLLELVEGWVRGGNRGGLDAQARLRNPPREERP